ncbi:MAG TPA: PKD domain-containing protein [Blastocatellia bacterium]|nr:PKD domain-containing protein [Blastocatellia bacterium]
MPGLIVALLFVLSALAQAQTPRSTEDPRNQAPTVTGGTGLFTVYDAQTLRKGEFNFGFFANHFHRDPADLGMQVYPINFQVGFGDHFEFFINFESQRITTVGLPALLSGFYLPDVRTSTLAPGRTVIIPAGLPGAGQIVNTNGQAPNSCPPLGFLGPCTLFGSPRPFTARPSGNDTAVYPGLGAAVGGILPALPPNDKPNYSPIVPFLSRFVGTGVGDIWLGGKIRLTGPTNPFGVALIPLVKIPTTRELNTGLERGRGTGAFDYGVILALDGRLHKHINLSTNIGYIKKGDPRADDMNLGPLSAGTGVIQGFGRSERALDLPNELRSGIGVDFPLSQYLQFIAEVSSTYYVGGRTPSLLRNSPVDLVVGAKIFPARWFSIDAAYQRHLNWMSNFDKRHSPNGFIFGITAGHANKREEPIVPNQPPTITLEVGAVTPGSDRVRRASASTVCVGDKVALRANASDPDGDTLLYSWTTSGGRIVGDGANVTFDASGLAPGDYTVTAQVDDGCGCVAFDTKTIRVENCPPLKVCFNTTLDVTPATTRVDAGQTVNLSTSGVTGGENYGTVTYTWTASSGQISGSGTSARLDTTGAAPNSTITVTVTAADASGECRASGSATVTINAPPPPIECRTLTPCPMFKKNSARVDNACKSILQDVVRQMQSDPQATLYVDGYLSEKEKEGLDLQRAKNVRDRLADGSVGGQIDPNRIIVRAAGLTTDGNHIKLTLCPAGAAKPAGGQEMTVGPVEPEKKAAPVRKKGKGKKKKRGKGKAAGSEEEED